MGILSKLFGSKLAKHVEWSGETIEVVLDPIEDNRWPDVMEGKDIRNRWADLSTVPNRNGRPKLMVTVDGQVVGEVPAAKLGRNVALPAALDQGVNVGVVSLRQRRGEVEALLFLGAGYKYRPKAPWAE